MPSFFFCEVALMKYYMKYVNFYKFLIIFLITGCEMLNLPKCWIKIVF